MVVALGKSVIVPLKFIFKDKRLFLNKGVSQGLSQVSPLNFEEHGTRQLNSIVNDSKTKVSIELIEKR